MQPTPEQISQALQEAERMREQNQDPAMVGHSLLYLHQRNQLLEEVLNRVKHYLHSGEAPREHTLLTHAIDKADAGQRRPHSDDVPLGL